MRTFIFVATCTVALLNGYTARAESPVIETVAARSKDTPAKEVYQGAAVVVVDARYILVRYSPLKTKLLTWDKELLELQKRHKNEQEQIAQLKQRLGDLVDGSPQFAEAEKELFHKEIESALTFKSQQRRLLRARAKLFADVYYLIRVEIADFMKENRIALVLNFDGNPFPSTPLTLAQLTEDAIPDWGAGGKFTHGAGFRIEKQAAERAAEPDGHGNAENGNAEDDRSSDSPQRVEQALCDATLGVNQDYDVTPLILKRLEKKAQAEVEKEKTAAAEKEAAANQIAAGTADSALAKKPVASRPPTVRVGRRSRTRR